MFWKERARANKKRRRDRGRIRRDTCPAGIKERKGPQEWVRKEETRGRMGKEGDAA